MASFLLIKTYVLKADILVYST